MYKFKSNTLEQCNHYVAESPDILHALVEATLTLSNPKSLPYLEQDGFSLDYEVYDLETGEITPHNLVISDRNFEPNSMLKVVQELACTPLDEEHTVFMRKLFPLYIYRMDKCASFEDAIDFAPDMLIMLLQYAYLIDHPHQKIEEPPANMSVFHFYFQLGFINYTIVNFTDLINYFFDFCEYCFDLQPDELLKLCLILLLEVHLAEDEL